jgi:hypothetical protein
MKFTVEVTQIVTVTLDETKFTSEFMDEFRQSFFQFDTLEEHAEHLAQLAARGIAEPSKHCGEFIEGYGPSVDMGITTNVDLLETFVIDKASA